MLLVAIVIAAVLIPIASGAPDKTYTLLFPAAGAVTPAGVSGSTTTQTLCAENSYTVKVELKNTAKTVTLGSANVTFPANVTLTGDVSVTGPGAPTASRTNNVVSLRQLSLPKFGTATVTVTLDAGAASAAQDITAVAKQSNDFNDSGGDANLFSDPTFPTIAVDGCAGTISGIVFNDKNENGAPDSSSFETRLAGWTVSLFKKNASNAYDPAGTATSGSNGVYTFSNVPLNKDYVVCETAPSGSWVQTVPTTTPATCSSPKEPNGWAFTFTASVSDKHFGNVATTQLSCGGAANANSEYTVQAGSGTNCKTGTTAVDYIYEKWVEGDAQFAAFHPALTSASCDLGSSSFVCTYFVMKVIWGFGTNQQPDPANRSLKYDDVKGTGGFSFEPMRYCKTDPRDPDASDPDFDLQTLGTPAQVAENVLPDGTRADGDPHSSCLITSTESVSATGGVSRVDYVFSAIDGRMSMP